MARGGARILRIGATGALISMMMIALPLILPRSAINKFLVAFGLIGLCWSLSLLLNGAWDMLRERDKR